MSMDSTTAGQPGVTRCSEATTGRAPTRRTRAPKPKKFPFPGITFVTDQEGRVPFRCHLDVPELPYGEGYRQGLIAAAELAEAGKALFHVPLMEIMREAVRELDRTQGERGTDRPTRRGAAVAILSGIAAMYQGACTTLDHRGWFARQIEKHDCLEAQSAAARASEKAAFVARMRAAKAAKRARAAA